MQWYNNLKVNGKVMFGFLILVVAAGVIGLVEHLNMTMLIILVAVQGILAIILGIGVSRSISTPLTKLAEIAEKIAAGELQVDVKVNSEKDTLANSMKKVAESLQQLMNGLEYMSKEHNEGDIDVFLPEEKFQGSFRTMAQDVNGMVKNHISVKKKAMACVAEFAEGNFDAELEKFPGKKAFINDNLEGLRKTVKEFISEMNYMSAQHDAGDIDVFVSEEKFQGSFRVMAQGVNGMVRNHISVKKKAMACVAGFAKGDFDAELEKFPGKKAFINDNLEALRKNLKEVNAEVNQLIAASKDGKLSERANTQAFTGDWSLLMQGLNELIDAIIEPVQEAADVLDEMSKGNLQVSVKGNYKGDHAKIKEALNDSIDTLVKIMSELKGAADQVASGSRQVSDSSISLSQGATEQASSIEQLTASLEEISAQTQLNAEHATHANDLAENVKSNAVQGNLQMKEMLKAMEEINDASANISKIIKVIDDIAFQTNILALNAAVEAARAGQHGKGFAVVAEEVRNLAARSANAAKETTDFIEGSIRKVEGGTNIANQTADALSKIVSGVTDVAQLVGDIATASNEQASGIAQINQGIMQVSEVVQTISATSEESASASEELASQAEVLRGHVLKFKLREMNPFANDRTKFSSDGREKDFLNNSYTNGALLKSQRISLSDSEYGKYSEEKTIH